MSDELKAAAERTKGMKYAVVTQDRDCLISAQEYMDLLRIRNAYLAEHPADGGEPLAKGKANDMGSD